MRLREYIGTFSVSELRKLQYNEARLGRKKKTNSKMSPHSLSVEQLTCFRFTSLVSGYDRELINEGLHTVAPLQEVLFVD